MTPSLPDSLKNETRALHTQAERSAFMRLLLRGEMERSAYCAMLRNLHAIYAVMEPALAQHASDPRLSPIFFPALARELPLRRDLDALHGEGWHEAFALQPATMRYVDRLHDIDGAHPELLVAHSYVRYLGDLSGGQMLGRIVRESMKPPAGAGTAFYEFGDPAQTARLKKAYKEGLDALAFDDATRRSIVAEAKSAFELHQRLFEELARTTPKPKDR